tara:strand:- start:1043 stop:2755 length:1713 start_codon:yes stop_codon:yes gene_type:complete
MKNLIPTKEALDIVDFGLLAVRQTTQGIRKSLGKSVRADLTRNSRITTLENVIADNKKKNEQENKLELLKQPMKNLTGGIRGAMAGTKSFFGGLLRAAGALLLGFLVEKLPEIIYYGQKIASIIKDTYDGAVQFIENIKNVFSEIVDVVEQGVENIKNFDFTDSEGKLQREIDEAQAAVEKTKTDFNTTIDKVGTTIEEMRTAGANEFNKVRAGMGLPPVSPTEVEGENATEQKPVVMQTPENVRSKIAELKEKLRSGEMSNEEFQEQMVEVRKALEKISTTPQYEPSTGNEPPPVITNPEPTTTTTTTPTPTPQPVQPQNPVIPRTQTQGASGSAEEFRVAAGLLTEGARGQAAIDVLQVVANRASRSGQSYTDVLAAGTGGNNVAFQGIWHHGGPEKFRNITTIEEAAKFARTTPDVIEQVVKDMRNPAMRKAARDFVKGALEFRGSPATIRAVNNDGNPNNNVAADADGRMPGTSWRGGSGDNQFMTDFSGKNNPIGPDPGINPPANINLSANPRSITVPFPLPPLNNNGGTTMIAQGGGTNSPPVGPTSNGNDFLKKIKLYNSQFT